MLSALPLVGVHEVSFAFAILHDEKQKQLICLSQDDKGELQLPRGMNAARQVPKQTAHSSISYLLTVTMATVPMATEWETTGRECLD